MKQFNVLQFIADNNGTGLKAFEHAYNQGISETICAITESLNDIIDDNNLSDADKLSKISELVKFKFDPTKG